MIITDSATNLYSSYSSSNSNSRRAREIQSDYAEIRYADGHSETLTLNRQETVSLSDSAQADIGEETVTTWSGKDSGGSTRQTNSRHESSSSQQTTITRTTEAGTIDKLKDAQDSLENGEHDTGVTNWLESVYSAMANAMEKIVTHYSGQDNSHVAASGNEQARVEAGIEANKPMVDMLKSMLAQVTEEVESLQAIQREQVVGIRFHSEERSRPLSNRTTRDDTNVVKATGVVQTADGKEIAFSLDLAMDYSFDSDKFVPRRRVDPLVLNFNGRSADLRNTEFAFDLDADGIRELVPHLRSGNGYLAFDRNEDGTINNGTELFGATSGNGFAELSTYDTDGNNWIDENDPIYEKLSVWMATQGQAGTLLDLKEAGVGAIHLDGVSTRAGLGMNSRTGATGEIVQSGVWLQEDGTARAVQQVDLLL